MKARVEACSFADGRAYLFDSEGVQRRIDKGATDGSSQSD